MYISVWQDLILDFWVNFFWQYILDFVNGYRTHCRQREARRKTQVNMRRRKRVVSKVFTSPRKLTSTFTSRWQYNIQCMTVTYTLLLLYFFEESQVLYSAVVTIGTIVFLQFLHETCYSRMGIHFRAFSVDIIAFFMHREGRRIRWG